MRALFTGVGFAAVAGLLLGGAMKPNLRGDDRPEGPQIFAGWSGVRSTGPFDPGMGFSAYQGQIPDYVIGTDWKAQVHAFQEDVAYQPEDPPDYYEMARSEPLGPPPSAFDEPPPAAPIYPSIDGGTAYPASDRTAEAPPPPPPPTETADLDEEAPPEATGDTTPAI